MTDHEYLVSYGRFGEFGRFRPVEETTYQRGDQVVVRSHQGLELGTVLCLATAGHGRFLSRTAQGELLRPATGEDQSRAQRLSEQGQQLFQEGRRLAAELALPLEILDVEILLDGKQAIVHHLRRQECDYRALVSGLSRHFDLRIIMQNLSLPAEPEEGHGHGGCGRPDCGQEGGGGGCSSCGSGGGCGTCGKATKKEEVADYLSHLRETMREPPMRTSLL
ncbi:MAG: hypothetical protein JO112_11105 [Planctomycetes bacterium]|nr:hypothetical protein [Planctomycetota bacterium]